MAASGSPWRRHPRAALLLLILTGVAGWLDAVTYLHVGGTFVSNQTGTVLFLAMNLAGDTAGSVTVHLTSLSAFVVGAAAAARALPAPPAAHLLPRRTGLVLVGEAVLIMCAAAVTTMELDVHVAVALLALAMGMEAALAIRIGLTFLTTGYVTGALASGVMASPIGDRATRAWWYGLVPVLTLGAGAFLGSLVANHNVAWSLVGAGVLVSVGVAVAATS